MLFPEEAGNVVLPARLPVLHARHSSILGVKRRHRRVACGWNDQQGAVGAHLCPPASELGPAASPSEGAVVSTMQQLPTRSELSGLCFCGDGVSLGWVWLGCFYSSVFGGLGGCEQKQGLG